MGTDTTAVLGARIPLSSRQFEAIKGYLVDREFTAEPQRRMAIEIDLGTYVAAAIGGSPTPDARGYLARLETATEFSPAVMVLSPEPPDRIECELEEAV